MSNPSLLDSIMKWISAIFISAGGLGAFLYFLLKKTLEKTVDSRFDARLEKIKHELQLEQQRMSIVYEHQKDSFRKILIAMHHAMEAIERNAEGEIGEWNPISEEDVKDFSRVLSEETLFMDSGSDHAVRLFRKIMWSAVRYEETYPSSDEVWRAYNQMHFVSDHLAEHFRIRVGLEPTGPDPLLDIELLGACRLINRLHFTEFGLPTKGPLEYQDNQSTGQLVAIAREQPDLLKSELSRLKDGIKSKYSTFFFETLTEADRYLRKLT
ncbi:MAG: hypothetical protein JWQ87_165 [Candidatus Sulfotelmatobacter sp.]|nr:hypothetical protein [Candidatus Sulfotelmatobacter sp.]